MISSSQGGSTGLQIAPREHELYNRELGAQRTVARSAAALLGGHTSPPALTPHADARRRTQSDGVTASRSLALRQLTSLGLSS
eukprot:COSAG02_NODE_3231_length_7137_cov_32.345411_8_plen_83_part_00